MTKKLNSKEVAAYLLENPDFFVNRDNLLLKIQVPHKSKGTISLVEKQLDVIRERQRETKNQLREFIEVAEQNKEIFDKSSRLILGLIAAPRSSDFFNTLENGLKKDFGCKANAMVIFGKPRQINHFTSRVPAESARKYIGGLMRTKAPTLGVLRPREQDFLFRHQSEKVKSAAVLTIRDKNRYLGVLAIGSGEPQYFTPDMDTLFISFIADALAKLLPRHLPR